MVHGCPRVIDGIVGVRDVALHLNLHFILCSIEILENVSSVVQPNGVLCLEGRQSVMWQSMNLLGLYRCARDTRTLFSLSKKIWV